MTLASIRDDLDRAGISIPVIAPNGQTDWVRFHNRPARYVGSPEGEFYLVTLENGADVLAYSIDLDFTTAKEAN